jgi:hypothetical protein
MDTHLEVVVIPVCDVDRVKASYSMLGWRLDADVCGDEYRLVPARPLPRPLTWAATPASPGLGEARPNGAR